MEKEKIGKNFVTLEPNVIKNLHCNEPPLQVAKSSFNFNQLHSINPSLSYPDQPKFEYVR
ncbi:hypothetical protein HK099_000889, partial [Clydaea vesicula]